MSEMIFEIDEAKAVLAELVERAAAGEEIVIAEAGQPLAKLTRVAEPPSKRKPGGWEQSVTISEDFDEPLPSESAESTGNLASAQLRWTTVLGRLTNRYVDDRRALCNLMDQLD